MKKFPILKIPDVVFREVTSMMTPTEIIKLAMSDFKMELILRNRKYKLKAIHIQLGSINPQIGLDTSNEFSAVVFEKAEIDDRNPVIKLVQLRDRYQEDSDDDMLLNHVSLENMFSLYSSLDRLFSCPFYDWLLRLDELDLDEFWKFTKRILSLEFHRFSVNGESMSNDLLRELMDKLPEKAELSVNSGLPLDYNHPKALKFPVIRYTDARWVKIEDLFSIRNVDLIRLERTHFDCGDVNRFLNYWSECDEDMIEDLSITLKEETEIDEQAIFKNLIVISGKNSGSLVFMKARNTRNRKFVVSKLEFRDKKVLLSTWDPFKKDRLYEYSVLKLVHKIRDCEENIQKMENDFRGLRDTEKRKLQLELEELERKLTVLNRDFVVLSKDKINAIIVQTGNIHSQIDTKSARDCLSVFFEKSENDKRNPVTQLAQLQDKYREEVDEKLYITHVTLEEMFSIYSNLTRLFSCPFRKWVIIFDEMKLEEFWQYTERMLKLKFQRFAVHAKTMSNVVLTELMDKIPEKMEVIIDSDIPLDYSHPKALRFRSFKYTEARWLKIEDFFNIRNLCLIILDRTNFDCSDVIKFLNYWSDCDEDMMEGIAMGLKEGTQIDEEEIIKIFIVISDNESSHSRFFMKARNIGNRKFVVGQLEFRENKVTFSALDPLKEDCLYEYSILELLHQKRDFEEKIRKMKQEFRGLRDAENIRKLQLELKHLENKLTDLNSDYEIRNFET